MWPIILLSIESHVGSGRPLNHAHIASIYLSLHGFSHSRHAPVATSWISSSIHVRTLCWLRSGMSGSRIPFIQAIVSRTSQIRAIHMGHVVEAWTGTYAVLCHTNGGRTPSTATDPGVAGRGASGPC